MTQIRAGLIGLGMMGRHHARVLSQLDGVDFVGTFDPMIQANSVNQNKPLYRNLQELLAVGINYAVIAVPTNTHLEVALELAENGIHALIEKPLAHDSKSALEIARAFDSKGLIGAVGHIERFNPAIREARKRLELIGPLYQVATRRQGPFPGRISDVGVVKDLATHDIDITSWITGQEYVTVSTSSLFKSGRLNEDLIASVCTLSEGAISNHLVNWLSPMKERKVILTGEKGAFEIDTLSADLTFYENGTTKNEWQEIARFRGVTEGDITRISLNKREPLLIEHEHFRDAILGKTNEIVSLFEGFKTLEVVEAMLRSAENKGAMQVVKH
jgi:predicted dehydrogenase